MDSVSVRSAIWHLSNLIIDSIRLPRSDAYLMLKLIVSDHRSDSKQAENWESDCHEWVSNHERKSYPNPNTNPDQL